MNLDPMNPYFSSLGYTTSEYAEWLTVCYARTIAAASCAARAARIQAELHELSNEENQ